MTDTITKEEFWDRMDDVRAGMLDAGDARYVPMSHYVDREAGALWFITAAGTDLVKAVSDGPQPARYVVADAGAKIYACVDGVAALSDDRSQLDEIWNAIASAWFEGDKQDPDLRLVRLDVGEAEAWHTDGGAKFLYEIAKANLTDAKPDMGDTGKLRFN